MHPASGPAALGARAGRQVDAGAAPQGAQPVERVILWVHIYTSFPPYPHTRQALSQGCSYWGVLCLAAVLCTHMWWETVLKGHVHFCLGKNWIFFVHGKCNLRHQRDTFTVASEGKALHMPCCPSPHNAWKYYCFGQKRKGIFARG